jgi:hypothetical protein
MATIRRAALSAAMLLMLAANLHAQTRTYGGTFMNNWKTVGPHGHDQPMCAEPRFTYYDVGVLYESANCNATDFARGNLDNSIGFRAGRERDLWKLGPLSLVGGVDGSLSYTEYNLTQLDFIFLTASASTGVDLSLGNIRLGGRIGAGPFATSDGNEFGFQRFAGAHLTVPLRPGAAIRISRQSMRVFGSERDADIYGSGAGDSGERVWREPHAIETSILLVTSPEYVGASRWEFAASTGTTAPGGPIGGSRMLRASNFSRIEASRELPRGGLAARLVWTASAHESSLSSNFRGYDGNYRSKTIDGIGLGLTRTSGRVFGHFSYVLGAGVEVADWRDEHQLLTRDNQPLVAGIETAFAVDASVRWHVGRNLALVTSFEKLYWQGIDLGETRFGFGLALTR